MADEFFFRSGSGIVDTDFERSGALVEGECLGAGSLHRSRPCGAEMTVGTGVLYNVGAGSRTFDDGDFGW